jgi:hypothetical protein
VAATVEALDGWKESAWPWDVLPVAEPGTWAHLHFAVGVAETTWDRVESSRVNRGANGALAHTTIVVRWLYRLRADASVADYDAMLTQEAVLLAALLGTTSTDLHLRLESASRITLGDGAWSLGDLRLDAIHRTAIQ